MTFVIQIWHRQSSQRKATKSKILWCRNHFSKLNSASFLCVTCTSDAIPVGFIWFQRLLIGGLSGWIWFNLLECLPICRLNGKLGDMLSWCNWFFHSRLFAGKKLERPNKTINGKYGRLRYSDGAYICFQRYLSMANIAGFEVHQIKCIYCHRYIMQKHLWNVEVRTVTVDD